MNKNIKITLNYAIRITLAVLLTYVLYTQVSTQLESLNQQPWQINQSIFWFYGACIAGIANLYLEVVKWQYLVKSTYPISILAALKSFLAGLALSFITPNRIGEYPGRLMVLKKKNTVRLLSLSVLGAFAQMFITILMGNLGLGYYLFQMAPQEYNWFWLLPANMILTLLLLFFFFRFEKLATLLERLRWLRKLFTYQRIMQRVQLKDYVVILVISFFRFLFFTAELLLLLYFFAGPMSYPEVIFLSILFFWAMTVIPSFAIAELGIRGSVALVLFSLVSSNTIGILLATFSLWIINLVFPALLGSILVVRKKWLR